MVDCRSVRRKLNLAELGHCRLGAERCNTSSQQEGRGAFCRRSDRFHRGCILAEPVFESVRKLDERLGRKSPGGQVVRASNSGKVKKI